MSEAKDTTSNGVNHLVWTLGILEGNFLPFLLVCMYAYIYNYITIICPVEYPFQSLYCYIT